MDTPNTSAFDTLLHSLCNPWDEMLSHVSPENKAVISEVRFRTGRPISLTIRGEPWFLGQQGDLHKIPAQHSRVPTQSEMEELVAALCGYSIHTHAQEIRQGYISLPGGGRAGLCGQAILQNGELRGIEHIASLNLRIAREIPGAADPLMAAVYSMQYGMLIYGPPGSGKTTILKDVIRQLTDGSYGYHTVAAADERGELQCGTASLSTLDHLLGYPKHTAVTQAARTLAPEYIICDEIGTEEEVRAMAYALGTGVKLIATVHAGSREEFQERRIVRELIGAGLFDWFAQLDASCNPCNVVSLYRGKRPC